MIIIFSCLTQTSSTRSNFGKSDVNLVEKRIHIDWLVVGATELRKIWFYVLKKSLKFKGSDNLARIRSLIVTNQFETCFRRVWLQRVVWDLESRPFPVVHCWHFLPGVHFLPNKTHSNSLSKNSSGPKITEKSKEKF